MVKSINEPGKYTFEGLAPGSVNEPVKVPAGVFAPRITSLAPTGAKPSQTVTIVIAGTGFFDKSTVFINDINRTATYNANGTLSVTWKPMGVQTAKFRVRNGAYTSNVADFIVSPNE